MIKFILWCTSTQLRFNLTSWLGPIIAYFYEEEYLDGKPDFLSKKNWIKHWGQL